MDSREQAAREICSALEDAGHRALLAGGCVRDLLLGVPPNDYDIATTARADEVAAMFQNVVLVGAAFGVVVVNRPEGSFEVATFRRDGPYRDGRHPTHIEFADEVDDARRRDFTVNAMFLHPVENKILDYVGGQQDILQGLIRTVGIPERRFEEDRLRLLRAVRFAARFGYEIEPATFKAIQQLAPKIAETSAERVRDEIVKILTEGGARMGFELLDRCGLLHAVLPEVAAMKGVQQPPEFHPEGDVWEHTLQVLAQLESKSATLAMGALLHDVGKPVTQTFEDRIRFNHHDKAGARMSEQICRRLRFSNEATERIVWLVEQHMRVAVIPEMRESRRKRFVREEGFDELLQLCRMDCLASHGDTSTVDWVADYKNHLSPEEVRPDRLLDGENLIAMGYPPGPLFREILAALEDAQLEGTLNTVEEAKDYVAKQWPSSGEHVSNAELPHNDERSTDPVGPEAG